MALRLLLAKRWLSDSNQISKRTFSLSAIHRDTLSTTEATTSDEVLDQYPKLPYIGERKLDHDLVEEHPVIVISCSHLRVSSQLVQLEGGNDDDDVEEGSSRRLKYFPKSQIGPSATYRCCIFFIVHEISGIPEEHLKERLVRISKAAKNAMQSGTDNTHSWVLQFDNRQRWENNLMGWISSGDPLSNLEMRFNTKEQAISYCEKFSYPYYVEKEKPMTLKKKSYAENFSWNKRTRTSTK